MPAPPTPPPALDAAAVRAVGALLSHASLPGGSDSSADHARVELLAALESVKNAAAGVQAQLAVGLDVSVRTQHAAAGVPAERQGRGVASQVALARAESTHRGQQLLGLAKDLVRDLPNVLTALRSGALSEYRATLVARESGCLDHDDRRQLDAELFSGPARAETLTWGTRQLAGRVRSLTYRLDPVSTARRSAQAESDRQVTIRPAPDSMTYLTALLPVAQGVAAYAELTRLAASAHASGDPRSKGQLMADLLASRLTGCSLDVMTTRTTASGSPTCTTTCITAPGTDPAATTTSRLTPSIRLNLIMSDRTLFGGSEPAQLLGPGVPAVALPAIAARALLADALDGTDRPDGARAWIRRLYTDPGGRLIAMTSTQRLAPAGLAQFLRIRDLGICRTPWCDAPAVESDHITPNSDNGPTTADNLDGLCAACNRAKQAQGWQQEADVDPGITSQPIDDPALGQPIDHQSSGGPIDSRHAVPWSGAVRRGTGQQLLAGRHSVVSRTPTGHTYRSVAPQQPAPASTPLPTPAPGPAGL